jgi:hypothetical protein
MGRGAESGDKEKEAALTPNQLRVLLAQPECRKTVITEVCLSPHCYLLLLLFCFIYCFK